MTEYMNAGNLRTLWQHRVKQGRPRLQWDTLSILLRDAARGLHHLHKSNLLHRDVKTENFLVNVGPGSEEVRCAVCDFGFSRNMNMRSGRLARAMTICGTESFMAPEVSRGSVLLVEKDVPLCLFGSQAAFWFCTTHSVVSHSHPNGSNALLCTAVYWRGYVPASCTASSC